MTPKGVEHEDVREHLLKLSNVKIPMTPKGVEHIDQVEAESFTAL